MLVTGPNEQEYSVVERDGKLHLKPQNVVQVDSYEKLVESERFRIVEPGEELDS